MTHPSSEAAAPGTERLSPDEVRKVARLARLRLTDAEVELFAHQLSDVLAHADDLAALDLHGVQPLAHPLPLSNVMREDVVGELLDREHVLAAAPAAEEGRFRVPPVLGEDG